MSKYTVEETLEVHRCYSCGIIFALPERYVRNRKDDGVNFYCPNSHSLAFPKRDDNGETVSDKLSRLEEENTELKTKNVQLLAQLDQIEAKLTEVSPSEVSPPKELSREEDEEK